MQSDMMVQASDLVLTIAEDQCSTATDKLKGLAKQFGLLE